VNDTGGVPQTAIPSAADPLAPTVVNRPARRPSGPCKVVVFNGYGCGDTGTIFRFLSRPPLAGAAVILLCEVDLGLRRSHRRDCAGDLAAMLSMSYAYGPEFGFVRRQPGFTSFFGNAILSAAPLEDVRTIPLPVFFDWTARRMRKTPRGLRRVGQRGGMIARVRLEGRTITLGVAHLENRIGPEGRAHQIERFLAAMPREGPAIIGGDFNTTTINLRDWSECAGMLSRMAVEPRRLRRPEPYEPLFAMLERAGFRYREANAPLAPTFHPIRMLPAFLRAKLDWIALRGLEAVPGSARVANARQGWFRRLSDHDFVACEFTLPAF
jgi:endonuclease/exonuclease/phosphatase family metal-dependent hydrolase